MKKKKISEANLEKFFELAKEGDERIIDLLESESGYINAKDEFGETVFLYLIEGNRHEITKRILDKKLSSYSFFKERLEMFISDYGYRNDNRYEFLTLLKEEDQKSLVFKCITPIVKFDNFKALDILGVENILSTENKYDVLELNFAAFTSCSEEMLNKCLPVYKGINYREFILENGFKGLEKNKVRTYALLENLSNEMTTSLMRTLKNANKHCEVYFERKDLKTRLEQDLVGKGEEQPKPPRVKI